MAEGLIDKTLKENHKHTEFWNNFESILVRAQNEEGFQKPQQVTYICNICRQKFKRDYTVEEIRELARAFYKGRNNPIGYRR